MNCIKKIQKILTFLEMRKVVFILFIMASQILRSQNIDLFTGAYSQGFPLITVPSNRGAAVELNAVYNSGIRVKQSASDIGLGWDLSGAGEITRQVVGYPDDLLRFWSYAPKDVNTMIIMSGQGALYPDNKFYGTPYPYSYGASTNFDIGFADNGLDTTEFAYPDYDNFNVSAPGLHGNMGLKYFKAYQWNLETYSQPLNNLPIPFTPPFSMTPDPWIAVRKPQFYFKGSFYDTLISRHFPTPGSTTYVDPSTSIADAAYPGGSTEAYLGKHVNGASVTDENYDPLTGRLGTENFVEYFRNGQIDSANGSFTGDMTGFMDYKIAHTRAITLFPSEGIGYFRVTNTQGFTYHYALPVYQRQNISYSTPLEADYSINSVAIGDFSQQSNPLTHPANNMVIIRATDNNTYAVKWLLTAITGPDYVDNNGNNYPDDVDEGYWVRYDYVKWSDNFVQRYPQYGFDYTFRPDVTTQEMPNYMPQKAYNTTQPGQPYKLSGNWANASASTVDIYYLNKIRTSSHTAVFVREVRKDEKGGYTGATVPATAPAPLLYLKRILLFKNNDFNYLFSAYNSPFTAGNYTSWNFNGTKNSDGEIFNESWYQGHASWDAYVLNQVEFDQDYSLSKNYHGNIETSRDSADVLTKPTIVQANLSVGNYASSGKLTLKRILSYGYQNVKLTPSTKFSYALNPDYNPIKEDNWGFYKSDATTNGHSRYTSLVSQSSTKAWSLSQIEDPLGARQEIVYESNTYNKVLDDESSTGVRGASFIYRIREAEQIEENFKITMEEGSSTADQLNEFVTFCTSSIPGLKRKVCIPAISNTIIPEMDCYTCGMENKLFYFGNCNITLNSTSTTSDKINGTITTTCINNFTCENPIVASLSSASRRYNQSMSSIPYFTTIYWQSHPSSNSQEGITYSGNGFLMFETPVGYNVYGNGIRVASIKTINENGEEYVKKYEYENGTAMNEMDRFEYPRLRRGLNDPDPYSSPAKYTYLESKKFGPFVNQCQLGYSKVIEKDMGRLPVANGKKETYFLTDPLYKSGTFFGNTIINSTSNAGVTYQGMNQFISSVNILNECVRKFTSAFGAVTEQRVYDKNNILLSKVVNDYEITDQGAIVEVFSFKNTYWYVSYPEYFQYLVDNQGFQPSDAHNTCTVQTTNILREYPIKLKSTTTYFMNSQSKQEVLKMDELTGQAVCVRNTDQNGNTSLTFSSPTYKKYQPLAGLSISSAAFRKLIPLRETFFSYVSVDSTLTGGLTTFAGASYNIYSNLVKQRSYSSGSYSNISSTLPYYINNRKFVFDAGPGSLNEYGLFNKSSLYQNPLSFSNTYYWEPTSPYNWRLASEVTLIDKYRHIVESRDAIDRFSAAKYAYNGDHKSASVSNCNFASFTYAGFEAYSGSTGNGEFEGELLINGNNSISNNIAHTGIGSLVVTNGYPATYITRSEQSPGGLELGLMPGRIYRASVWVHITNLADASMEVTVNGYLNGNSYNTTYITNAGSHLVATIDSWNLIQLDFEVPEGFSTNAPPQNPGQLKVELKTNGGPVNFDDFILHPVESQFSAFVFDLKTDWLTATIDANGISTRYVYDANGKVKEEWKEVPSISTIKKTKTWTYHYGRGANN